MKKDILENIKQEYNDMLKISNGDFTEITELENNPVVQRYRHLLDLKKSRDLVEKGKRCIVGKVIEEYGHGVIKESNNIWCLLFETEAKKVKGSSFEHFDKVDEDQIVVLYQDIENSFRTIAISKANQEEFEATHNVVFGKPHIYDSSDRYYNTRRQFFEDCITNGQEEAVKKILSRQKDN